MGIVVPRRQPGAVSTEPLPNFRHTADEFASPQPVDLSGLSRAVTSFAEREQAKADDVAILDADNQLSESAIALQSDALKMQGKDAMGALPQVQDKWQQTTSDIESTLTNDRQRMRFRERAQGRWAQLHETVQQHTDAEYQKYDASTTDAALQLRLNDAVTHYTDPEAVAHAADETRATLADFGARHGLSPEVLQAQTAAAVSKLHVSVIGRMLDNEQDLSAKKYYDQVKDQITGTDAAPLEKALDEGSVRGESQRQADQIIAGNPTRSAALDAVRKITDPKVRDATETRVNESFSEKEAADRDTRESNMLTATNIVDKSGSVYQIPTALWTTFTLGERAGLKEYARQKIKGDPIETNWTTYYDLQSLASSDATRDKFLSTNLLHYRSQLSDSDFQQLVELQSGLRRGDERSESKLSGIRTSQQIVGQTLRQAGINPNPKPGSDDADRVSLFNRAVDEQALLFEEQNKRKPNSKELQSMADNLVVEGTIAGTGIFGFFQTHKREFERTPGEGDFILDATDIPRGERSKIEDALKRAKQPVTDATVLRLYQQKLSTLVPSANE